MSGRYSDILGVWADPIACTDVLCFGPLDYPWDKLPEGVKHPTYLFNGVVEGIGSYGNSIGIPTVNGAVLFAEEYTGNVVVYAGCVGVLKKDQYIHSGKPGDFCVLAGGRTGLDGIHGVTFASAELTNESEQVSRPAVQIANPIEEEKLKRAIQHISELSLGSAITDIGGGGLSCGVCETAEKYGLGVNIDIGADETGLRVDVTVLHVSQELPARDGECSIQQTVVPLQRRKGRQIVRNPPHVRIALENPLVALFGCV